jgi:FtsH-binding integral membrane protein
MAQDLSTISKQPASITISRRLYNLFTFSMVTVSFIITWLEYQFVNEGGLATVFARMNPFLYFAIFLGGTIGGLIVMSNGKSKQSVSVSLIGYALFTLTFGGSLALLLTHYNVGTITYAFGITACISGIFLIAGVIFPDVFAKIGRVLVFALLAVIVVEFIATVFLHAHQGWIDYIVILIFCGFLGYDSYRMSLDEPTVPNAIFYAADIYIDMVNILIRVLRILDRN